MDPSLLSALAALAIAAVGALTALVEKIRRDLSENTRITKQAKQAADGTLRETLERLAAERNRTLGLREIVRERDDRIAYIIARHPEIESTLNKYRDRRTRPTSEADERAAERAVLDWPDDPTGADAGAHPLG